MLPTTNILTMALSPARSFTNSTTSFESIVGFVFGIQQTVVNPPLAALLLPVSIVSLYSNPGSLKCTCKSIKPGVTHKLFASIILSASSNISSSIFFIIPSIMRTSFISSKFVLGFITLPPLINIFILPNPFLNFRSSMFN